MTRSRRDESGAVAVIFAFMMTLLFVIGALTVDLGNAFVEKRERAEGHRLCNLGRSGIAGANLPATSAATCSLRLTPVPRQVGGCGGKGHGDVPG